MITSYSPSTGAPIAEVVKGTVQDYNACVEECQKAFKYWSGLPAPKRGDIVRQIGDALRQNIEPLGKLVSLEMGKFSRFFLLVNL